jgi:hypothetical protein
MSSYKEFLEEKEQIDYLVQQGYQIKGVTENLSGAFVEFELRNQSDVGNKNRTELLHISNAETRKYFSSLIILQNKKCD